MTNPIPTVSEYLISTNGEEFIQNNYDQIIEVISIKLSPGCGSKIQELRG